ncbi:MAG: PEGA domain-containing protein, partial [Planctomycetota bacterium]
MYKWIIACLCLAACFAFGEGPFVVEGVGYQEVKLGKTTEQIIQTLGEPEERSETGHIWLVWRKSLGIDIIFPGGTAREIRFNPGFKGTMANGIGIGSEMDAVLKAYGQPNNTSEVGSSENAFADQTLYVLPMGYKILYVPKGILFWFDTNKKVIQFVIVTPNSNCGVNPNPGPTITVGDPTPPPELKGLVTLKKPYPQSYAGAETDRISAQYAVMEIVKQVGLGYNWDASFANTNPTCRKWVYPAIENKPCDEALQEILTPVGLDYITKGKQVILVMGNGGGNQADGATTPANANTPPANVENPVRFNVKANMDGALVYIDGVNIGKAGDALVAAKGQHICTVAKQGYMDFTTADFLIRAENGLAHFHVRQECKSSAFRSRDGGKIIRSVRVARRQLPC